MSTVLQALSEYFRHPSYVLYGLAAALLPLLIYIFYRWKQRRVRWAAMVFLLRAKTRLKRRLQAQQLIMLLVRTALVVALVLGLARPLLKRGAFFGQRNGLAVIVLDTSYSMGLKGEGGKTLLDTAKDHALAVLESLGEGDRVALVTIASGAETVLKPELDQSKAIAEIRRVEITDGSTNLAEGLKEATKILEVSNASTRMAYLITDLQANAWLASPGTGRGERGERRPNGAGAKLEDALKKLGEVCKVTIIDVNRRQRGKTLEVEDCAVVSLTSRDDLIAEGMPSEFVAQIVNTSGRAHDVTVEWEIEGVHKEPARDQPLARQPEPVQVTWKHTFQKAGNYRVIVRIRERGGPVGIPADDERFLALSVRQAVHVLIVQGGDPKLDLFEREADFLFFALQPEEESPDRRISVASRKVLPESDIATARFSEFDVVVLANVRLVPPEIARKLENFVRQGGGLLVFLGDNIDHVAYNQHLYRDGKGVLPAELVPELGPEKGGRTADETAKESVGLEPLEHPMTVSLRSGDYGQPAEVMIRSYVKVRADRLAGKVVCRYTDGAAAVIENKFGLGTVALVTTACDRDWSNLPVMPLYAPFVQDAVQHLLRKQRLNLAVGEKWTKALFTHELGYPVTVAAPGGRTYAVQPEVKGDETIATYDKTAHRGFYRVGIGDGGELVFAANVDPEEGRPQRVSEADLLKLFPKFEHKYFDSSQDIKKAARELMAGSELGKPFLLAALGLACLEVVLAYAFRKAKMG